jgi:anti-sigma factor RsiW
MRDHLTEQQVLDLLLADPKNAAVEAHLQICDKCRQELESIRFATEDFKELGGTWAERQAVESVRFPFDVAPQVSFRQAPINRITLPAAAALVAALFGVSIFRSVPHHAISSTIRTSNAQIVADNLFLREMDQDLRYGSDVLSVPASELGDSHTRSGPRKRSGGSK